VTVLLADDHFAIREGLKFLLSGAPDFDLDGLAETATLADTRAYLRTHDVDLVLLDIGFPDGNGLDVIREFEHKDHRVLVLSMFAEGNFVLQALQAGARGFVAKDTLGAILVEAVHTVVDGGVFVDPASLAALADRLKTLPATVTQNAGVLAVLSPREREIFSGLVRGDTVKELAVDLGVSPKTVENHRSAIYQKLGVEGYPDLVRFARERKLL
jgi:DNA-binding NarL/FixJ family response regulator